MREVSRGSADGQRETAGVERLPIRARKERHHNVKRRIGGSFRQHVKDSSVGQRENDVILALPDGRVFHVLPKRASDTTLDVVMPLLPSADRQSFYTGSFTLTVGTAPGYLSHGAAGMLLELPQLTTPPGVVLSETLDALTALVNASTPAAGAAMSANGAATSDVQALQAIPRAALAAILDLSNAARAGTPRSFDV